MGNVSNREFIDAFAKQRVEFNESQLIQSVTECSEILNWFQFAAISARTIKTEFIIITLIELSSIKLESRSSLHIV